jgi:hypothetical protein
LLVNMMVMAWEPCTEFWNSSVSKVGHGSFVFFCVGCASFSSRSRYWRSVVIYSISMNCGGIPES